MVILQLENFAVMDDYRDIVAFLESSEDKRAYPSHFSTKNEKRNFRRRCNENYKLENGQLLFRKSSRRSRVSAERNLKPGKYSKKATYDSWKVCIETVEQKERVLKSCHSSKAGIWDFNMLSGNERHKLSSIYRWSSRAG